MTSQIPLAFTLSQRTVLVPVETVRAALGVDAETIYARIETGEIMWAWDIAVHTGRVNGVREIRIWARDFVAPGTTQSLDSAAVVNAVIGTERDRLRAVEVAQLFIASRPHIDRLVTAGALCGPLVGHTQWITRESLERFLHSRLVR